MPVCAALIEADVPHHVPVNGSGVSVEQIAKELEKEGAAVDAEVLYMYMRYVSSLGVFKERHDKHFAHNDVSTSLMPGQRTFYFLRLLGAADGARCLSPSTSRSCGGRPDPDMHSNAQTATSGSLSISPCRPIWKQCIHTI